MNCLHLSRDGARRNRKSQVPEGSTSNRFTLDFLTGFTILITDSSKCPVKRSRDVFPFMIEA
jgi:hypothetical protein